MLDIKSQKLYKIGELIQKLDGSAQESQAGMVRKLAHAYRRCVRGLLLLYREMVRDDALIRAESLSYFSLFSVLPILAGLFLLLSFFSDFGPIQNEFNELIGRILEPFPAAQRSTLLTLIEQFRFEYLKKLKDASSSIGVFAVGVLFWIGAKVYLNIEDLMNQIWGVVQNRSWMRRLQNFITILALLPLFSAVMLSVPTLIAAMTSQTVGHGLEEVLPFFVLLIGLTFVFKTFPHAQVRFSSALLGASISSSLLMLAMVGLRIYFKFGVQSAYGKAAALPLVAFFIFVFWVIFMIGAEVSFLRENPEGSIRIQPNEPTLAQGQDLMNLLEVLNQNRQEEGVVWLSQLQKKLKIPRIELRGLIRFLEREGVVLFSKGKVALAKEMTQELEKTLLDHFLGVRSKKKTKLGLKFFKLLSEI